jgi:glycosyltransferase involved in cell wall biosynthesis
MNIHELSVGDLLVRPWWKAFMHTAETFAYGRCDKLTGVSRAVVRDLREAYGIRNPLYVPNGIDSSRFVSVEHQSSDGLPNVLFVGNLRSEKGIFSGIAALRKVTHPFRLTIVGSGALRGRVEKEITQRVPFKVDFMGFVPNREMPRVYGDADILLMPSYSEGLPLVGLEGAAAELPIAGFEATSAADFIDPQNLPFIVTTGDIEQLSGAIDALLADETLRRQVGYRNRIRILEEFTIERMTESFLKLYRSNSD